jgi:hypothetical protein
MKSKLNKKCNYTINATVTLRVWNAVHDDEDNNNNTEHRGRV